MLGKQKWPFWQLCSVFAVIVGLTLALSWGNRTENVAQMEHSMADMMKDEHLGNTTVQDLFTLGTTEDVAGAVPTDNSDHAGHHAESSKLYAMHIITTALLVLTLPLILAGSLFLVIVWPKPIHRRNSK